MRDGASPGLKVKQEKLARVHRTRTITTATTGKSDEEPARGRCRRLSGQGFREKFCARKMFERRRRNQNQILLNRQKFQLLLFKADLIFLFRFFGGGDGSAQGTGMPAVKCHGNSISEGTALEVAGKHGCPRDRL